MPKPIQITETKLPPDPVTFDLTPEQSALFAGSGQVYLGYVTPRNGPDHATYRVVAWPRTREDIAEGLVAGKVMRKTEPRKKP